MENPNVEVLRVSKLEAARRQLETAALLLFNQVDPVSAHTLASAAYQILSDVSAKAGEKSLIEDSLSILESDELVREVRKYIRAPQNYFKHAERDDGHQVEFSPSQTGLYIWDGSGMLAKLTGERPLVLRAFEAWFFMRHPELTVRNDRIHQIMKSAAKEFGHLSPLEFFRQFQANASKLHTP